MEEEAETVRTQLVDADGRVAGKSFFGDHRPPPFSVVHLFPDLCLLLSELEMEL
jgi:hypothetical protein